MNKNDKVEVERVLNGIEYKVVIEDVANTIKIQYEENEAKEKLNDFDYGKYHSLEEINEWIDQMSKQYPQYITIFNVSQSYEKRYLKAFKISIPSSTSKKSIWIDGGIHA